MSQLRHMACVLTVFLVVFASGSSAAPTLPVEDLIEKSVNAAGGTNRLSSIRNYTFRLGPQIIHSARDGRLKISTGDPPSTTDVALVDGSGVRTNIQDEAIDAKGEAQARHLALARLYGGLFTLVGFKDILESGGVKRFGSNTYHLATAQIDALTIAFYLDSNDFTLKRLVLHGFEPDKGKYEINYDFGPYQTIEGIRIPGSWFNSHVGSRIPDFWFNAQIGRRGEMNQVEDVVLNPPLDERRFSSLNINRGVALDPRPNDKGFSGFNVNAGSVKIEKGVLWGNIINVQLYQESMLSIMTNWTSEWLKKAGFKTKDTLSVRMGDDRTDVVFHESMPPETAFGPGAKLLFRGPEADIYIIFLISPAGKGLQEKLKPLLPIEAKLKE